MTKADKARYTRGFNKLYKYAVEIYGKDNVHKGGGSSGVMWADTHAFTVLTEDLFVVVVKNPTYLGAEGIHCKQVDLRSLEDALQVASRDGFETIYIHSMKGMK